jgi:hypothetical protein
LADEIVLNLKSLLAEVKGREVLSMEPRALIKNILDEIGKTL